MPDVFANHIGTLISLALIIGFFAVIGIGCAMGLSIVLLNQIRVDLGKFQEAIDKTNDIISGMVKLYEDVAKAVDNNLNMLETLRQELYISSQRAAVWKRKREEANEMKNAQREAGVKEWEDDWDQS